MLEIVRDFDFVSDSDRANAVARMLDPFVRRIFNYITPIYLVTATAPGTGKTLLTDALTVPSTGQPGAKTPLLKQDDAAVAKLVLSLLRQGASDVNFDNVSGRLYSSVLAHVVTAYDHSDRLLGGNDMPTYVQRLNWSVTGNNLDVDSDIGRRVVPIRLASLVAHPEERTGFLHPELISWEQSNRRSIVTA